MRLLSPDDLLEEHRALAAALDGRGAFINLYRAMAHIPDAFRHFFALLAYLWTGAIDGRLREIAILSVASALDAPYPFGWHVLDAADAGLSNAEIEAITRGGTAPTLTPADVAVATYARELTVATRASDATFGAVAEFLEAAQIVELTLLIGLYGLVGRVANGLNVELEDEAAAALQRLRQG